MSFPSNSRLPNSEVRTIRLVFKSLTSVHGSFQSREEKRQKRLTCISIDEETACSWIGDHKASIWMRSFQFTNQFDLPHFGPRQFLFVGSGQLGHDVDHIIGIESHFGNKFHEDVIIPAGFKAR